MKCKKMLYDSIDLKRVFCFVSLAIVRRYCSKNNWFQRARKSNYKIIYSSLLHFSRSLRYLTSAYLRYPRLTRKLITVGGPFFNLCGLSLNITPTEKGLWIERLPTMPSQTKTDPAKLRSQISRRVDNSFQVFAPLVLHAGHADREASWFGMPGMPGMKLACPARLILMFASASYPENHI